MRTVSEVAAIARVTVRTLHHYDEIGLLSPSDRTDAGYRLYGDADLARLLAIVAWRSLGLPLDEIRPLLDDPSADPVEALVGLRGRLIAEADDINRRIGAVESAIRARVEDGPMQDQDWKELFDGFDPREHDEEVKERWGETDAYKESARRSKTYGKADWVKIKAEAEAIGARIAAVYAAGSPADSPEAIAAVESHRAHIDRWFYPCSPEMHCNLAEMYVADPRFRATYEKIAAGLAQYVHDAVLAASARPSTG